MFCEKKYKKVTNDRRKIKKSIKYILAFFK